MENKDNTFHGFFGNDEVASVLESEFYGDKGGARQTGSQKVATEKRPRKATKNDEHYRVICISLYNEDLARLDKMVDELKQSGHRKMSRSALIRYALDTADLDALPRSY